MTFTSSNNGNAFGRIAFRASRSSCIISISHNVNPRTTFFLNPAAWTNPAPGTYATSKPYYGDYRGPRYPNEQLGFGKVVPIKEGVTFSLRADFFNVFNRWAYPNLNNTSNPFQTPQYNERREHFQRLRFLRQQHLRCRRKLCSEKWRVCRENPVLSDTFKGNSIEQAR